MHVGGNLMLLDLLNSEYKIGFAFNGNRVAGALKTIVAAQLARKKLETQRRCTHSRSSLRNSFCGSHAASFFSTTRTTVMALSIRIRNRRSRRRR